MIKLSYIVNIISLQEKLSKRGNTFTVLKVLSSSGNTKEFITNKDELEQIGYKPAMLSDIAKGKLVPVNVEVDPFQDFPKLLSFKPVA